MFSSFQFIQRAMLSTTESMENSRDLGFVVLPHRGEIQSIVWTIFIKEII